MANRKHFFGILVIIVTAFTMVGCLFSGTYTRNGNTAAFTGDLSGAATISGSILSGTFDGSPFTATRANTTSNSFAGTWLTVIDEIPVEFVIGSTTWLVGVNE